MAHTTYKSLSRAYKNYFIFLFFDFYDFWFLVLIFFLPSFFFLQVNYPSIRAGLCRLVATLHNYDNFGMWTDIRNTIISMTKTPFSSFINCLTFKFDDTNFKMEWWNWIYVWNPLERRMKEAATVLRVLSS